MNKKIYTMLRFYRDMLIEKRNDAIADNNKELVTDMTGAISEVMEVLNKYYQK